jgi:hypothetical protein
VFRLWKAASLLVLVTSFAVAPEQASPIAGAPACTHTFVPADSRMIPNAVSQPGTDRVFCFAPGTYDMNDLIVPHDGDQFIGSGAGSRGAIIRGARTLIHWRAHNGLYVHGGDVVNLELGGSCFRGVACQYPDWVFVDGRAARRVLSPCTDAKVSAGEFCIDYSAKKIYMPKKPARRRIEYSVVPQAIVGPAATGVTVTGLQITKYANTAKQGAAVIAGPSWLVDRVDINRAHGCAIAMPGSGTVIQDSHLHHNGQFGFCGSGGSIGNLFSGNEVDHNNTLGFDANVGAGGGKFAGTLDLVVSQNNVHHNNGIGIWLDADNKGATVSGNRSHGNTDVYDGGDGIKIEKSCDINVVGNTTIGNARTAIHVNNSQRVTVGDSGSGNRVVVPARASYGILLHGGRRDQGGVQPQCGPRSRDITVDNRVIGNDITMPTNTASWNGTISGGGGEVVNNHFAANHYHMVDCTARRWKWWDGVTVRKVAFTRWHRTLGQDLPPEGTCGP